MWQGMTTTGQHKSYRPMRRLARMGAQVLSDAGAADVTVSDISRDGARITPGMWMAPGSAVILKVADEELSAVVHWSKEGSAGLRFVVRPDPDTLRKVEESEAKGSR